MILNVRDYDQQIFDQLNSLKGETLSDPTHSLQLGHELASYREQLWETNLKAAIKASFPDLSGEIQDAITRLILVPGHIWPQAGRTLGSSTATSERTELSTAFLATSKKINKEATRLYYEENVFHLPNGYLCGDLDYPLYTTPKHRIIYCANYYLIQQVVVDLNVRGLDQYAIDQLQNRVCPWTTRVSCCRT